MTDNNALSGKVAIVTGAGRNIGRAIALMLAADGAAVVVNARANKAEADAVVAEIEAAGGKAVAHLGDIGDPETARGLAALALDRFGRIDILVNNAALRREKPIGEMSYAEWREVMDVTLDGAFHCVTACLPALKRSGEGRIVNMGGMSAHIGAKNRAHVMTAKAALVGFSRALAHDLGRRQDHRQLRGAGRRRYLAAGVVARPAPSHPSHADRRARPPGGRRRHGAAVVRAQWPLDHRPGHPRQRRWVFGVERFQAKWEPVRRPETR